MLKKLERRKTFRCRANCLWSAALVIYLVATLLNVPVLEGEDLSSLVLLLVACLVTAPVLEGIARIS